MCAAQLVTQQSAKGCTTRQSIVFRLSISTLRMSFRHMRNDVLNMCNGANTGKVHSVSQQCNSKSYIFQRTAESESVYLETYKICFKLPYFISECHLYYTVSRNVQVLLER